MSLDLSYYDSASETIITRKRALQELKAHGVIAEMDFQLFDSEMGVQDTYNAQAVLVWLGY